MAADFDDTRRRKSEDVVKTEDLLAGFDRPARTPRMPAVNPDFVDYHLDKRRAPPAPVAPPAASEAPRSRDMPTAIIPHAKPRWRSWLPWLFLIFFLPIAGLLVAALMQESAPRAPSPPATSRLTPSAPASFVPPAVSTALAAPLASDAPTTTIVTPPIEASSPPRRVVPMPSSSSSTAPINATPPAAPSGSSAPPPNKDFIRVL